jgi:hypothetical protein
LGHSRVFTRRWQSTIGTLKVDHREEATLKVGHGDCLTPARLLTILHGSGRQTFVVGRVPGNRTWGHFLVHGKTLIIVTFDLEQGNEVMLAIELAVRTRCIVAEAENAVAVRTTETRLMVEHVIRHNLLHLVHTLVALFAQVGISGCRHSKSTCSLFGRSIAGQGLFV